MSKQAISINAHLDKSVQIPVGCDDGHYGVKICAGPDKFFQMPSRSHPGRLTATSLLGDSTDHLGLIYEVSQGEYVTITAYDSLLDAVDTRAKDYPTSSSNRALVAHALQNAGFSANNALAVVTGLPINRYYVDGKKNSELIEAKKRSLLIPVKNDDGSLAIRITSHKVISEAVAAYYDALINFDGTFNEDFKEISDDAPIAVIDAGGKTLDIAAVKEGGTGLYSELSGTAEAGALFLYDGLEGDLKQRFNIRDDIPFPRLKRAIEKGKFLHQGSYIDVADAVAHQLDLFADRIAFEVRKLLGDASRFGKVLFVGGGANLLHSRLERVFPNIELSAISVAPLTDDPRLSSTYANARGMYKAALLDVQGGA